MWFRRHQDLGPKQEDPRLSDLRPKQEDPRLSDLRPKQEDPRLSDLDSLDKRELLALAKDMVHDWQTLNEIYNKAANRNHWCSTYETHQCTYNTRFKVFRLRGRNPGRELDGEYRYRNHPDGWKHALL